MGADQSNLAREQEYAREVAEREKLRHAREEQLQETLRIEKRKLYMKTLEAQQLQEALRRSTAETHMSQLNPSLNNTAGSSRSENYQTNAAPILPVNHEQKSLEAQQLEEALKRSTAETHISHLYPSLNDTAGSFRSETYQTNAAPNLPVNHDHLRFQPSAPPASYNPTVRKPTEIRQPPPRPRPPTLHQYSAAAPQGTTVRASAAAPQATTFHPSVAAPHSSTVGASAAAPQATTFHPSVAAPHSSTVGASAAAPQATTFRPSVAAPQATTFRPSVAAPQATTYRPSVAAPQATTVGASATAPHAATGYASATVSHAATSRVSAAAPHEKKITRKDDITLCKTCKKPYKDKIFQCKNGHSSCEGCWNLDLPCGVCRGPITNIRNFDLENYFTANQRVKCPNAAEGCILSIKKSEIPKHEKECPFKELKCPVLGNCNWKGANEPRILAALPPILRDRGFDYRSGSYLVQRLAVAIQRGNAASILGSFAPGKISQLSIHFDELHPTSRQANVDTEMFLPIMCNEYNSLQLIKMGNFNFLFYVKVSEMERKVYMDVQLIGTKATASKWNYEIHVYNKREPRRKYQYNDTCRSSEETPTDISLRNCAVLTLPYAMSFVNEGTLTYKFFIKKNLKEKRN